MDVAEDSYFEIAHGRARESGRARPVPSVGQVLDDFDSVHAVLGTQEEVEEEDLSNDVDHVEDLDDEEERD